VDLHLTRFDLRNVEDIVNERKEVAGIAVDLAQVLQHGSGADILRLLFEHLGIADDGAERRPQLVAHIGEELALGLVRLLSRLLGSSECRFVALAMGNVLHGADHADRAA
jgi:hypothetical protein